MTHWVAAVFLAVSFFVLAGRFGLVKKSKDVFLIAHSSFGVIRSSCLSDDAKETTLRRDAKQLFWLFFMLSFGTATAVILPIGLLWLCGQFGLFSFPSIISITFSPVFIITIGIVSILLCLGPRRTSKMTRYSVLDRVLHRLAFKTYAAQISLANIEDKVYAKQLALCKIDRPVFITALPRAGTTLLLECCATLQEFASHSYRDMPFVPIPCLWNRFSATFRKIGESRERAHGDGMLINFDSPEALEEVLWKIFWRRHYCNDRIIPWQGEDNIEFEEFFRNHMRKIIFLRRGKDASAARYVSKNNLNIARIAILHRLFPCSVIIVLFRQPLQHAASLLKQHRNFIRIHKKDSFASEYMRAIGHYDFGENLCPVDFAGWFDERKAKHSDSLAFWLEYWVASYKHLLKDNTGFLHFLSYEEFCDSPERGLQLFANVIESRSPDALISQASCIHQAKLQEVDIANVSTSLIHEADHVYAQLRESSFV